jgi:Fe2+ transport system protein B
MNEIQKSKTIHSPTLETVLMVEETLKKSGQVMDLAELKKALPKKVMHQTLKAIIDYLQISGKVIIGMKGILWIFEERKELNKLISKGLEL